MTLREAPALALFYAAVASLAACSAFDPYPTYPQQPEAAAKDAGPRVAICYDPIVNSGDAAQKAAQDECGPSTLPVRVDTDWKLDYCPLSLPARATFVCSPKK
jgi:hypothetical protein